MTATPWSLLDRRQFVSGMLAVSVSPSAHCQNTRPIKFLDPAKFARPTPEAKTINVLGRSVSYLLEGAANAPLIVYFHGYGGGYKAVLPREYKLLEEGYRLLVPHRPGYAGTPITHGTSPYDAATMVGHLFNERQLNLPATVAVIGTSGGAPAALKFADLYSRRVKALIIQAGVSHPWNEWKYVPEVYQPEFRQHNPLASSRNKTAFVNAIYAKANAEGPKMLNHLVGPNLAVISETDPAFPVLLNHLFDQATGPDRDIHRAGEDNDVRNIFLRRDAFVRRGDFNCPTLFLHEATDPFVPIAHAEDISKVVASRFVRIERTAGHFIWFGDGASNMHAERMKFLREHHPVAP